MGAYARYPWHLRVLPSVGVCWFAAGLSSAFYYAAAALTVPGAIGLTMASLVGALNGAIGLCMRRETLFMTDEYELADHLLIVRRKGTRKRTALRLSEIVGLEPFPLLYFPKNSKPARGWRIVGPDGMVIVLSEALPIWGEVRKYWDDLHGMSAA